jgi:hypothetical protein
MGRSGNWASRLGLAGGFICAVLPALHAAPVADASKTTESPAKSTKAESNSDPIALANVPASHREKVRAILTHPTLHTRGPVEVFRGQPLLYEWLLDHPDKAVLIWRRIGARCAEITERGNGRFGWSEKDGSDIVWETVSRSPTQRVWYAEGSASPGPLLPMVSIRAVVVMRHAESVDPVGRRLIHHQAELYMQTDSKAAALMARLVGSTAPKLAEQCVGQMEIFFSALVWYLDRHPDRMDALLLGALPANAPSTQELRRVVTQIRTQANPTGKSYNATKFLTPMAD